MLSFDCKRALCIFIGAGALATAALAETSIQIGAHGGGNSRSNGQTFADSVKVASGYMSASNIGASGSIFTGGLACPGLLCPATASGPGANATATFDMNRAHLGVQAYASANPPEVSKGEGSATINVSDVLFVQPGSLTFNIHLSFALGASGPNDTFSSYKFGLVLFTDPDFPMQLFNFSAWDDPNHAITDAADSTRGARVTIDRDLLLGPGNVTTQDIALAAGGTVYQTSVVVPFMYRDGWNLQIYDRAEAEAQTTGTASVSSLNSGYLGITGNYSSAAGYN